MLETLTGNATALLSETTLKSLPLLAVAGVALLCLRRASAAARHLVLLLTLVCLLFLPLLSSVLPERRVALWTQPVPHRLLVSGPFEPESPTTGAPTGTETVPRPHDSGPPSVTPMPVTPRNHRVPWGLLGFCLWVIGAFAALVPVVAGLFAVVGLRRRSAPVTDRAVTTLAAEVERRLGLRRPVILRQALPDVVAVAPMTWGWRQPTVLLPATPSTWPEERLRVVLLHELAHVRRSDWLWQMLAHGVCALYWFHPGVWLVARRLRMESETACDDQVLSAGITGPEYARHLIAVARMLSQSRAPGVVALPMATSQVEQRLKAIVSTHRKRGEMKKQGTVLIGAAAVAALFPLAMLRPVSGAQQSSGASPASDKKPFVVVIDAGHGGQDTGAVGLDGTFEKDINLAIAQKLKASLTKSKERVVMTRTDDTFLPLMERPAFVKANGAQYLVSVHCDNQGSADSKTGITVFYHARDVQGLRLASAILEHMTAISALRATKGLSDTTRFVHGFGILRGSPVPSVLIECGFINNSHDLTALHQERTQQQIADGIAAGLDEFAAQRTRAKANASASATRAVPGEVDADQMMAQGRKLTAAQCQVLERKLAVDGDNLALHIEILGYYSQPRLRFRPGNTGREAQILWLIKTHPTNVLCGSPEMVMLPETDGAAYAEAKRLWLSYAEMTPPDPKILGNAVSFLTQNDFPDAERLSLKAEAIEPKNTGWPDRLGHLYQLQELDRHGLTADYKDWAKKALAQYERVPGCDPQISHNANALADIAKAAYDAGAYDKAQACAQRLLELPSLDQQSVAVKFFGEGNTAVHEGNMILGRLALRSGDVPQAKARLLAMGNVSGSSSLSSFGPNMQLAQDLLQHGEQATVLKYFDECARFWKADSGLLAQWRSSVERGQIPDFGGNLVY